jgi:hypothetical protein
VPVSSSQAAIGAVIGIGIAKGGRGLNFRVLGKIASGWVTTPVAAGVLAFVALFFVQNVFEMEVVRPVVSAAAVEAPPPLELSTDRPDRGPGVEMGLPARNGPEWAGDERTGRSGWTWDEGRGAPVAVEFGPVS